MARLRPLLIAVLTAALGASGLGAPGLAAAEPPWSAADHAAARALLDPEVAALPDSQLNAAVVAYAETELGQRVRPEEIDRLWAIAAPRRDVAAELAAARAEGRLAAWLASLSPTDPGYRGLQAAAASYRRLVATGGWRRLPAGKPIALGVTEPEVATLRERLALEGYSAPAADPQHFDPALATQLSRYQADRSLPPTGKLDPATRAALDVPAADRLATLEANLERWRWLPRRPPATRFELDIAAAEGRLIKDGTTSLQMRVVVGDVKHKTPMFASALTGVVFDPPWNVPAQIAAQEILPKAARDPGYLARNDFVVTDGRLQQQPGPKNALGAVKFDLSSPFGVYLHDTPAKTLFGRAKRTLSHGCMRLEKPQALAEALLEAQGWTAASVAEAMAAGHTQATALRAPLPLYVLYWTADLSPAGRVRFRPDVYGWDRALLGALARARPPAPAPASPGGCGQ